MSTHRNEEGKKGSVATCVCDTTSGCSLFLLPFDVMVGLIYREELTEIPGCDGISTPSKKNWELLWKSGGLRVLSHKQIPFHTPSSAGQCHNLPFYSNSEEVIFCPSWDWYVPWICVFCALLHSDLGSVGDLMPPQAIVHSVKHNETDKREKGHPGELPEAAFRFSEPPENEIGERIYFHPSLLAYIIFLCLKLQRFHIFIISAFCLKLTLN